jgi:DNA-binding transcriptional ArsR family regulator
VRGTHTVEVTATITFTVEVDEDEILEDDDDLETIAEDRAQSELDALNLPYDAQVTIDNVLVDVGDYRRESGREKATMELAERIMEMLDEDGATVGRIARLTGESPDDVQRTLAELAEAGKVQSVAEDGDPDDPDEVEEMAAATEPEDEDSVVRWYKTKG